ncbi:MAG: hypothetical protein OEZ06_20690 [Myxococcales bacterium]|nr:hypothetical protein [Myxococcales bacterium]
MKARLQTLLWGFSFLSSLVLGTVSAQAGELGVPVERLNDGNIETRTTPHPGTELLAGSSVGIVEAPYEEVLKVVEDYGRYADRFMPHFDKSKVLSRRGSAALVYIEATIAKGMVKVWAQVKVRGMDQADGTRVVEAKLMKGNLAVMHARFHLKKLDAGRTLVGFKMIMDPDLKVVPDSLVNAENEKWSRRVIKRLRRAVVERRAAPTGKAAP